MGHAHEGRHDRAPARSRNLITNHWNGRYSPLQSFLLTGGLIPAAATALLGQAWRSLGAISSIAVPTAARITLAGWLVATLIWIWAVVGTWRSAGRHAADDGNTISTVLIRASLATAAMAMLLQGALAGSSIIEMGRLAIGFDDFGGPARISVRNDTLLVDGPLSVGTARQVMLRLGASRHLRTLSISSTGGRVGEAQQIAGEIRRLGLDTVARQDCLSACTLVILAGTRRSMASGAHLGFHQASFPGATPKELAEMNVVQRDALSKQGVSPWFIDRVLSTPSTSMWIPTEDELFDSGFLNYVTRQRVAAEMALAAEGLRKTLPRRIDAMTTLEDIRADGLVFRYLYRANPEAEARLSATAAATVISSTRAALCRSPSNTRLMKAGGEFSYTYLNSMDRSVLSFVITSCHGRHS